MNEEKLKSFERETLMLFKELADAGQSTRALEVLRIGLETIALCKRLTHYQQLPKEDYGNSI